MVALRQTSFAAGELSPRVWGRTDLELFSHGARKLSNFFVAPQGAAVSRPGTTMMVEAKKPAVVLLPFIFSESVAYVLELGEGYLRIHHPSSGYTGVELTTPYLASELGALQWAQVGSIMVLAHQAHAPRELRAPVAGVSTTWVMVDARFTPPGNAPTDTSSLTPVFRAVDGSYRLPPMPVRTSATSLYVDDATHPAREWRYKVSTIMRHKVTGEEVETMPLDIVESFDGLTRTSVAALNADNLLVLYADRPIRLAHPTFGPLVGALGWYSNWEPVASLYYRGRGRLFGFIGQTRYAQDFIDFGDEPDYARQPVRGTSPFVSGENPAAVAFFQQRRCFAGSSRRPSTMWASGTDAWSNHDAPFPPYIAADSALEVSFYARKREAVRAMVAHQRLLAFTDGGVWSLGGAGGPMEPTNLDARLEDECGATTLQPLVVDGAVLYVRAKGRGVKALSIADSGAYQPMDITWHAEHLFRGADEYITSWCFARDPWATIWAVRADGALLSCTRTGASMWAWAKHDTGVDSWVVPEKHQGEDDRFLSVVAVPDGNVDAVWVAVSRGGRTWLERLTTRDRDTDLPISATSGDAALAIDCMSSAEVGIDVEAQVTGLERFEGRYVWAVAPGNAPQGPLQVKSGAVTVGPFPQSNFGPGAVKVLVGLAFVADLELLDAARAGRTDAKTVITVGFEVDSAQGVEVGEDFSNLTAWRQRAVADSYLFPSAASLLVTVHVKGSWRYTGRAVLRQTKPLPVTVLGISRELDVGGKT